MAEYLPEHPAEALLVAADYVQNYGAAVGNVDPELGKITKAIARSLGEMSERYAARDDLRRYMENCSESAWCASWLMSLEFILWRHVLDPAPNEDHWDPDVAPALRQLSDACGGWIVWIEGEPMHRWVSHEEWATMYEANNG